MKQYVFNGVVRFKKIGPLELGDARNKVMRWFFSYPAKEISLNDITRSVNVSKSTANKVVMQLAKEGFLKIQPLGKVWRISCDQKHSYNSTKKVSHNLELIYDTQIVAGVLSKVPNARSIILFGSYRKGDDNENSDIDIAVEIVGGGDVQMTTLGIIPMLDYRKNVKVNALLFSRNRIDLNLFANLVNGIVLYGFLEARP